MTCTEEVILSYACSVCLFVGSQNTNTSGQITMKLGRQVQIWLVKPPLTFGADLEPIFFSLTNFVRWGIFF